MAELQRSQEQGGLVVDTTYESVHGVICDVAWRFKQTEEVEDLIQEGYFVFLRALVKYDPSRGASFPSYLRVLLRNEFLNKVKKENRRRSIFCYKPEADKEWGDPKEREDLFWCAVFNLGQEAQEVIGLLLNSPGEILEELGGNPRARRGSLYQRLRSQGWGHNKVWTVFGEIKQVLMNL